MLQYTESNRSDRNIMQAQLVMQLPMRLLQCLEATHLRGVCVYAEPSPWQSVQHNSAISSCMTKRGAFQLSW